jgi:hypothetical protein
VAEKGVARTLNPSERRVRGAGGLRGKALAPRRTGRLTKGPN